MTTVSRRDARAAAMRRAATACTLARIAMAPLFAWSVAAAASDGSLLPALIVVAGMATDFADGRLARAAGEPSRFGRLFDHGADALFLFPALGALAADGRVPVLLPAAASTAFALYLADGWKRGRWRHVDLTSSPVGAAAGVLNYAIAAIAAGAIAAGGGRLDEALYWSAALVAVIDLAATVERLARLAGAVNSSKARATPAAGKARPAARSSP